MSVLKINGDVRVNILMVKKSIEELTDSMGKMIKAYADMNNFEGSYDVDFENMELIPLKEEKTDNVQPDCAELTDPIDKEIRYLSQMLYATRKSDIKRMTAICKDLLEIILRPISDDKKTKLCEIFEASRECRNLLGGCPRDFCGEKPCELKN